MIIGISGRAGSGKTLAATFLSEMFDVVCIDLDQVGHALLLNPDVVSQLVEIFGEDILDDSVISRSALGKRVFDDPSALRQLNTLLHPRIKSAVEQRLNGIGEGPIIIVGALLKEIVLLDRCDAILVVDAPDEAIRHFGSSNQIRALSVQRSRYDYRKEGDVIIYNTFEMACFQDACRSAFEGLVLRS